MSIDNIGAAEAAERGVSRRKVIKAAAWSAPVVALAVASPMAAASITPQPANRFYSTVGVDQTVINGIFTDLAVVGGAAIVEGAAGYSVGTVTIDIWIPSGYVWQEKETPHGWVKTRNESGRVQYQSIEELKVGGSSSQWFPGGTLVGSGALPGSNAASLRVSSTAIAGPRVYWPSDDN